MIGHWICPIHIGHMNREKPISHQKKHTSACECLFFFLQQFLFSNIVIQVKTTVENIFFHYK